MSGKPVHTDVKQDRLKELLRYNPHNGEFRWRKKRSRTAPKGAVAGRMDRYGYVQICIDQKICYAHRLAWLYVYGYLPEKQVDHINHVRDDNRISNLRVVSNQDNQRNATLTSKNKSGIVGVSFYDGRWSASIKVDGKTVRLGQFSTKEEAAMARKAAERRYGFHINHGAPSIHQESDI